ncbi:MAG: HEPN domain-containing protein [Nitrospinae bacterium]|nr:HEPN domain-containing protein [Nitrospinota bacterium]
MNIPQQFLFLCRLSRIIDKPSGQLEVAEKLFKSGDYEDTVSRAYYAVFHADQAFP